MSKGIVILVSGNGSNAQAIIDACEQGVIKGKVRAIISNQPTAYALKRASNHNIDAIVMSHKDFPDRESFDKELLLITQSYQPDLVVLAGFMRILTPHFVRALAGKLLNIHPSLLPKYPGLNTHQRALDNHDTEHGSSVHFVTAELDGGPIVLQGKIAIGEKDTAETLASRLAQIEWQIYPKVVEWFCDDRLVMQGKNVILDTKTLSKGGIVYE